MTDSKPEKPLPFVLDGRCLREVIRDDAINVYEKCEGPVSVRLFNTEGKFVD
jgi:hypothetical protein